MTLCTLPQQKAETRRDKKGLRLLALKKALSLMFKNLSKEELQSLMCWGWEQALAINFASINFAIVSNEMAKTHFGFFVALSRICCGSISHKPPCQQTRHNSIKYIMFYDASFNFVIYDLTLSEESSRWKCLAELLGLDKFVGWN